MAFLAPRLHTRMASMAGQQWVGGCRHTLAPNRPDSIVGSVLTLRTLSADSGRRRGIESIAWLFPRSDREATGKRQGAIAKATNDRLPAGRANGCNVMLIHLCHLSAPSRAGKRREADPNSTGSPHSGRLMLSSPGPGAAPPPFPACHLGGRPRLRGASPLPDTPPLSACSEVPAEEGCWWWWWCLGRKTSFQTRE